MPGLFSLDVQRASDTELRFVRRFAASPALVYQAHIEPALIKKWLGVHLPLAVCEVDARVGGGFRYVWRHPEMGDMGMTGSFLELEPGVRIAHTELFDQDWTGGPTHVTSQFLPDDAGCRLDMTVRYSSAEGLEGALKSGMTDGMAQGYDYLDGVLGT